MSLFDSRSTKRKGYEFSSLCLSDAIDSSGFSNVSFSKYCVALARLISKLVCIKDWCEKYGKITNNCRYVCSKSVEQKREVYSGSRQ